MAKTVLRTTICDRLGIEYPVVSAGMGPTVSGTTVGVAGPELVAAVSNAGGLGVLGGTGFGGGEMAEQIRRIQALTDKPFGVDILLPAGTASVADQPPDRDARSLVPPEYWARVDAIRDRLGLPEVERRPVHLRREGIFNPREQVEVIVEMGVPVLAIGLGSPAPYADMVHRAGVTILSLVGDTRAARRVAEGGADVVIAQGHEAGGHTGRIGTLALVPQVIDAVAPVPVLAAGGIGDGRGLAAALALGCAGVWCGTAFIATPEAHLDDYRKHRILDAPAEGTQVTRLYSGKTMRNVGNELIDAWEASGLKALPLGVQGVLVRDLLAAARQAGREDLLVNPAGQISGLLRDLRPAAEVLEHMVGDAAEILDRLPTSVTYQSAR